MRNITSFEEWRQAFLVLIQQPSIAADLKLASLTEDLMSWTNNLTTAVVRSCESLGWAAAGKWNPCQRLPKAGQEYLSIDVMALASVIEGGPRWPMPVAVFELENHAKDDRVAYSLWKVICVRAPLRVVFAYRPDWEHGRQLVSSVCDDVIGGMTPDERSAIDGQVVMVVGNRGEGETFPWGYFKFWLLNSNLGKFERV